MTRLFLILIGFLFAVLPAQAQFAFTGDIPLNISSETATYEGNITTLIDNVVVIQGDTKIMADKMVITRAKTDDGEGGFAKFGDVERIDAQGSFEYITPDSTVTGQRGVYQKGVQQITVTGNVAMRQGSGSVVRGERLIYDLETKRARVGNQCVGDNCQSGSGVTFTIKKD